MGKLKINKSALNRAINSAADKATQKLISAGDKAQKEIRKKYTENWFLNKSDTMSSALRYKHRIRKHHDKTVISFNSYVDMGSFSANVLANDRSIYEWKERYGAGIDPPAYLLDLQWNQGIHGLPEVWTRPNYRFGQMANGVQKYWYNPYFNQGIPMSAYVRSGFASEWENTVLSYL